MTTDDIPRLFVSKPADVMNLALAGKKFITWAAMHRVMFGGDFRNARIPDMIQAATRHLSGADALLVDKQCRYSPSAPVEQHYQWLRKHGYAKVPRVK